MLIEEKKKKYKEFIQSKEFTLSSYASLSLFQMNIGAMNNIIKHEATLAEKLMDSEEHSSPDSAYIQLDILCKIMIMIEGQCALILAVDSGKKRNCEGNVIF